MKNPILLILAAGIVCSASAQQTNSYFSFNTSIPVGIKSLRTLSSNSVNLTFINQTERYIDFRWVDFNGNLELVRANTNWGESSTGPGNSLLTDTYVGHVFIISDPLNGQPLGFVRFLKQGAQTISLFENSNNIILSNSESAISAPLINGANFMSDSSFYNALATNPLFLTALAQSLTAPNNTNYGIASKINQSVSFSPLQVQTYKFGKTITLNATSSAKLPITYTCANPSIGIIQGNILLLQGTGSTTVTASQVGNQFYNPAIATQSLLVK